MIYGRKTLLILDRAGAQKRLCGRKTGGRLCGRKSSVGATKKKQCEGRVDEGLGRTRSVGRKRNLTHFLGSRDRDNQSNRNAY